MSESKKNKAPAAVPGWQLRPQKDEQTTEQPQGKLDIARRFLEEDQVKTASREKKQEFLRSKDIPEADIQILLGGSDEDKPAAQDTAKPQRQINAIDWSPSMMADSFSESLLAARPPVVTYPEFLSQPERPGPLVTTGGLINALCAFAGLSTVLYGASEFVIAPMVESLTQARAELCETALKRLDDITTKLESTVSIVPPRKTVSENVPKEKDEEEEADYDDPSEMFHRDVGTQTSSTSPALKQSAPPASENNADRLAQFTKSLSNLKDDYTSQNTGLQDVKTVIDVFRDELDAMTYGDEHDFTGGFDMYGKLRRAEPDDEIRKARDNIRRIKGVLLSTRSFPASVRS